ncbi:MAG: DUF3667 domain-containing protein [Saprospiraceae bacterium]|jgi:hypothetical protein|nr:DUF3667 domain-containing protein [Saprospiraceae bacterium]
MEDENPRLLCRNCHATLPDQARFCPQCSQKNHDGRLSFGEMVSEAMGTLFNLDNRIFSTLRAIVVPGKLTTEYFEGKHIRYYHPLRLFLFTGLALISILTVRYRQGEGFEQMEKISKSMQTENQDRKTFERQDSLRAAFVMAQNNPDAKSAVDSFAAQLGILNYKNTDTDSSSFGINAFGGNIKGVKVASKDLFELSTDDLLEKYKVEGFWNRLFVSRTMRAMKGMNEFLLSMFGNAIWMLLVLMPLMALVLKLLYIRKPFLYYEHFVFNLHLHAAMFLLLFLTLVFTKSPPSWLIVTSVAIAAVYPFMAMRRVYKQGFWKTSLKYFIISISYSVLASLSILILAIISFAIF